MKNAGRTPAPPPPRPGAATPSRPSRTLPGGCGKRKKLGDLGGRPASDGDPWGPAERRGSRCPQSLWRALFAPPKQAVGGGGKSRAEGTGLMTGKGDFRPGCFEECRILSSLY